MKSIFKSFVIFAFLVCNDNVSAQGLVSMPEMNILYKNYDNILKLGFANGLENFNIQTEGAKWTKSGNGCYIIRPDEYSREVKLLVFNQAGEKLKEQYYFCINIPELQLYWGSSRDGGVAAPEETNIFVSHRHAYEPFYYQSFRSTEWTVSIGDTSVKGTGNKLSKEVRDLIYAQKQKEVIVKITSAYISSSNSKGNVSARFKVINPYFFGQISNGRVFVIDKDSINSSLFDENDPFSLISQIHSSYITEPIGISQSTAERLTRDGNQSLEFYYSDQNFIPIADSHGNDSITVLPDGTMEYVYYPRQIRYYDKSDITRLVFYENTHIDSISQEKVTTISHVGLAKKYPDNNKYDIVMLIPFRQLSTCSNLGAIYKESNNPSLQRLLSEVNRTQTKESKESSYTAGSSFTDFNLYRSADFPFEVIRDHYSMKIFDSIFYYVEQQGIPLYNSWGEDSSILLSDGTYDLIYPEPDTIVYRAYINPKDMRTFLQYELRMDYNNNPQLVVTNVVYTIKTHDANYAFCSLNLDNLPIEFSNIFYEKSININELPWKYELRKEIEKAKTYSLSSKKDIKSLANEFNLDILMGKPANLLGVSDKINIK
jgi:hypothetical protein